MSRLHPLHTAWLVRPIALLCLCFSWALALASEAPLDAKPRSMPSTPRSISSTPRSISSTPRSISSTPQALPSTSVSVARTALAERLDALNPFHAHFAQFIEGARGQVLEESTGELLLSRPGFRWQVDEPYPQVIVTDGAQLSIYDPDLAQVIVKELDTALADTPIALLTQTGVALSDRFDVVSLPGIDGEADVYLLTPTDVDSLFQEIQLHFDGPALSQLLIFDHLGQSTTVRFRPLELAGEVPTAAFVLELPDRDDVLEG
ncbi:MAG: outer membrane lipoprotein chaperone LolA [Pseudomonadota bacterium]